jgi:hypothetical protein
MATPTCTGKSAAHVNNNSSNASALDSAPDLEFPIVPDFSSLPRHANAATTIEFSDFYARKLATRPELRRAQSSDRCEIQFDLYHPKQVPPTYPSKLIDELLDAALTR